MRFNRLAVFMVALGLSLVAVRAFSGGPVGVGVANEQYKSLSWKNNIVEWYADSGNLSKTINNKAAVEIVKGLFDHWTGTTMTTADKKSVSTVSLKTKFKDLLDKDIDSTNYYPYVSEDSTTTKTVVIFDEDGSITKDLGFTPDSDIGLSAPLGLDSTGLYFTRGVIILNGKVLDKASPISLEQFKGVILHEIGHLLGLDHGQTNDDIASQCADIASCEEGNFIPTMYPELKSAQQSISARDDKVILSAIYPSEDFKNNFCRITGEVFDAKGNPLKQVNVVATIVGEGEESAKVDARAFVTGALGDGCEGDSRYYLQGILPGKKYQVTYEPLNANYTGSAHGFRPLADLSDEKANPQFKSGKILSSSNEETVVCENGGDTIEMASATIDVSNPCTYKTTDTSTSAATSSKCSLYPLGERSDVQIFFLVFAGLVFFVVRKRISRHA